MASLRLMGKAALISRLQPSYAKFSPAGMWISDVYKMIYS